MYRKSMIKPELIVYSTDLSTHTIEHIIITFNPIEKNYLDFIHNILLITNAIKRPSIIEIDNNKAKRFYTDQYFGGICVFQCKEKGVELTLLKHLSSINTPLLTIILQRDQGFQIIDLMYLFNATEYLHRQDIQHNFNQPFHYDIRDSFHYNNIITRSLLSYTTSNISTYHSIIDISSYTSEDTCTKKLSELFTFNNDPSISSLSSSEQLSSAAELHSQVYEKSSKPTTPVKEVPTLSLFDEMIIHKLQKELDVEVYTHSNAEPLTWDALAGYDKVKQYIQDTIVNSIRYPEIYDRITRMTRVSFEYNRPKALLLEGPPGTGKHIIFLYINATY